MAFLLIAIYEVNPAKIQNRLEIAPGHCYNKEKEDFTIVVMITIGHFKTSTLYKLVKVLTGRKLN